jgi:hypothetical protein
MASLLLALTIYTAAFIAEIVRAGIQAVSHGQTEASFSLGLNSSMTLRLVILPQALRVIIPPLTNQYLNLTKNSSLAAAIGYPGPGVRLRRHHLNQTGQAIECIAITMAVYLTISLLISLLMNWYNRRSPWWSDNDGRIASSSFRTCRHRPAPSAPSAGCGATCSPRRQHRPDPAGAVPALPYDPTPAAMGVAGRHLERRQPRGDCQANGGACWVFVRVNFEQFMYGFYPEAQRWRVNTAVCC